MNVLKQINLGFNGSVTNEQEEKKFYDSDFYWTKINIWSDFFLRFVAWNNKISWDGFNVEYIGSVFEDCNI